MRRSPDAKLDGSKPISGGVPHCFPQFGPGKIQQHGFARNLVWDVRSKTTDDPDRQSVTLMLQDTDETMAMWPHKFEAIYTVGLEEDRLDLEFRVKNTDTKPFDFTTALHTYFAVTDINKCEVTGKFEGVQYLDKMEKPPKEKQETRKAIVFDKEVDSVYAGVSGEVTLVDKVKPEQSTTIRNLNGWEDTVLWNPYGNEGMGYKNFACVESGKVAKPVVLGK
jgi:glucose-6-phosphate 1-epimerase